ncbi:hypothetical protein LXL04_027188 [Taraxacum kok-saghyz]
MDRVEGEEMEIVSDISEGSSNCEALLPKPIRGVRNDNLPPFVSKLYDIVSNESMDSIISWVGATSFVIWNEQDFVINLLPMMSKSNSFSSFVTQLNNYGFKKISWDRREYAHEWFQKGEWHLLKNIKRRSKPNTCVVDKMMLEMEKLERESKELDLGLVKFKEYVEKTILNQKSIVQAMANTIKSTLHGARISHELKYEKEKGTNSLKASMSCQSSCSQVGADLAY